MKPAHYHQQERQEMFEYLPKTAIRSLLDVGCGAGVFGQAVKRQFGCTVWGIEPVPQAAIEAKQRLDFVVAAPFGDGTEVGTQRFDCVVFNDVLEHLANPIEALRTGRGLLEPGGSIVASIPNVRNYETMFEVLFRKDWRYRQSGVLDDTHLRFFTRKSIERMFGEAGLRIVHSGVVQSYGGRLGAVGHRAIKMVARGLAEDLNVIAFGLRAVPI